MRRTYSAVSAIVAFIFAVSGLIAFSPTSKPRPTPHVTPTFTIVDTRSTVARALNVQDCPTVDSGYESVCVWDGNTLDDGGAWLWIFGHHFHVGFNADGTIWVDDNHDGEPGYTDS